MLDKLAQDGYVAMKSEQLKTDEDGVKESHVKNLLHSREITRERKRTGICPTLFDAIIQTSIVPGHPGSKFIVPIESPRWILDVCYLISFKSKIVSVTIFEIFAAKISDLDLGQFKVIPGQSS